MTFTAEISAGKRSVLDHRHEPMPFQCAVLNQATRTAYKIGLADRDYLAYNLTRASMQLLNLLNVNGAMHSKYMVVKKCNRATQPHK